MTLPPGAMGASTRRQLTVFAIICLVVSWGLWLVAGLHGTPVTSSPAIWWFALGASGPSLAALGADVVLRHGNVPRTRVRAPWLWLPLALVLGALPAVVTEAALDAGGFGSSAGGVVAASGGLLLFVVTFLAGPLAEEFGWRGYLQPRLRTRFGILATAAVVGAAWAVWHVPLFFLEGTGQQAMGLFTLRGLLFMVSLLPLRGLGGDPRPLRRERGRCPPAPGERRGGRAAVRGDPRDRRDRVRCLAPRAHHCSPGGGGHGDQRGSVRACRPPSVGSHS